VARLVWRVHVPAEYRAVWRAHDVRVLTIARFLANVMFYSTVIVAFERSRGLTFTEMFLLESILSATSWLLDIPTGVWAEQIGYRRLLVLARVLELASLVITIFAYGFWPFALGSVLYGAHLACASGCEDALAYASLPGADTPASSDGEGARLGAAAFSMLGVANSAGFFVGLALGSFLGEQRPVVAVVVTLVPMTLALGVTLRLSAAPAASSRMTSAPTRDARPTARELLVGAWRLVCAQPALVGLSLGQSAAFALVNAIFWYNQPYFASAHIAVRWYGPLTALAVGAAAVTPMALPRVVRRMGRRWTLAFALVAPGLAYVGLGTLTGFPPRQSAALGWLAPALIAGLIVVVVGGSAWRDPLISDELARRTPARGRAAALSALSFVGTLAGIALNPLIGRVGDGELRMVGLALGAGLVALALGLPWLLERPAVIDARRPT